MSKNNAAEEMPPLLKRFHSLNKSALTIMFAAIIAWIIATAFMDKEVAPFSLMFPIAFSSMIYTVAQHTAMKLFDKNNPEQLKEYKLARNSVFVNMAISISFIASGIENYFIVKEMPIAILTPIADISLSFTMIIVLIHIAMSIHGKKSKKK